MANFCSRLSPRCERIFTTQAMETASRLLEECCTANSIFPQDENTYNLRKSHLLKAKGALNLLDIYCYHIYETLKLNPQGAFRNSKDKAIEPDVAVNKLDSLAQNLGELIDAEFCLLDGIFKSDKTRIDKLISKNKYAKVLSDTRNVSID